MRTISITPTRVTNFIPCRPCHCIPCPGPGPEPGPGPGPDPDPDPECPLKDDLWFEQSTGFNELTTVQYDWSLLGLEDGDAFRFSDNTGIYVATTLNGVRVIVASGGTPHTNHGIVKCSKIERVTTPCAMRGFTTPATSMPFPYDWSALGISLGDIVSFSGGSTVIGPFIASQVGELTPIYTPYVQERAVDCMSVLSGPSCTDPDGTGMALHFTNGVCANLLWIPPVGIGADVRFTFGFPPITYDATRTDVDELTLKAPNVGETLVIPYCSHAEALP